MKGSDKLNRLFVWALFGVVFALGPLFANWLLAQDKGHFTWDVLIRKGELFLIAAAIVADAIGRVWSQKTTGLMGTFCMGGCVLLLFLTSVEFGMVAPTIDAGQSISWHHMKHSLFEFGGSVVAGLGAVLLES
jgi:hypothetical protein